MLRERIAPSARQSPKGTPASGCIGSARVADQVRPFRIEHLPDRALRLIDVLMSAGVTDALVQQPSIQFIVGFEAQPRREEAFPHQVDLVLDLALLPPRRRRAYQRTAP